MHPVFPSAQHLQRRHSPEKPWTYALLDRYQRQAIEAPETPPRLLLSELAPVITLGRRADPANELTRPPAELLGQEIEVYPTDRGGLATWHGPGQWVLFPVAPLALLTGDPRGVRQAVEALLEIALLTAKAHLPSVRHPELLLEQSGPRAGLWLGPAKLASVGVAVQQGVLLHGLSLNVLRHPLSFYGLRPCGLDGVLPGFLSSDPYQPDSRFFQEVGATLLALASERFQVSAPSR